MDSARKTIEVTNVDSMHMGLTTPRTKISLPKSNSRSPSRHAWVYGSSPLSGRSANAFSHASENYLSVPAPENSDEAYTTPKNKDGNFADQSNYDRYERIHKNLQAPKKRNELIDEESGRKHRAYDPDNLSIRAFRLETCSDNDSTENSSPGGSNHEQAAAEMRTQWNAFSQRIQAV